MPQEGPFLTLSRGIINSFGVFQPYYMDKLNRPPADISWIGSFEVFLLFFIGTFAGRLTDAGYFRPLYIVGVILVSLGTLMTSFCSTYWQFFLAQGICVGLGNGLLFCPCMAVTSTYFAKKRSLAFGLTAAGSTTGGLIFPSMVRQLLPQIGFAWTIRSIALIQFATLILAGFFMKSRIPPRSAGPLVEWAAFKDLEYTFYAIGAYLVRHLFLQVRSLMLTENRHSGRHILHFTILPHFLAISSACRTPPR